MSSYMVPPNYCYVMEMRFISSLVCSISLSRAVVSCASFCCLVSCNHFFASGIILSKTSCGLTSTSKGLIVDFFLASMVV